MIIEVDRSVTIDITIDAMQDKSNVFIEDKFGYIVNQSVTIAFILQSIFLTKRDISFPILFSLFFVLRSKRDIRFRTAKATTTTTTTKSITSCLSCLH